MQLEVGHKLLQNPRASSHEDGNLPFLYPHYTKNYSSPVQRFPLCIFSMRDVKMCSHGFFYSPGKTMRVCPFSFIFFSHLVFLDCVRMLCSCKPWAVLPSIQRLCISFHLKIFHFPQGGRTIYPPICHFHQPFLQSSGAQTGLGTVPAPYNTPWNIMDPCWMGLTGLWLGEDGPLRLQSTDKHQAVE